MVKKIFEVEYDDNLHLADASGDSAYKRGLLYDDDGNLKEHAKMREINEDELYDRGSPDGCRCQDNSCGYSLAGEGDASGLTEEDVKALVELGALIAGAVIVAAPHVKRWWSETAAPHLLDFFGSVSNFVQSRLPSEKIGSQPKQPDITIQVIDESLKVNLNPVAVENELNLAYSAYRSNMNSEEAKKAFLEIVVLSTLLAERIKKLSKINVTDKKVERAVLDWRDVTRRLTSDDLINCVNMILQSDLKLLTDEQLSNLEFVLDRSLYMNGQYVPIDAVVLRNRLAPHSDESERDSDDTGRGFARIAIQPD